MCLDEPIKDILVNYTLSEETVDLYFEEMYGTEIEFLGIHNEKVPQLASSRDQQLVS